MTEEPISVLIADDHPVVREGLAAFLGIQPDIALVGEACNGEEAVARTKEVLPDVVLVDVVMPGMGGIEATRGIREASPSTKVIILTSFAEDDKVIGAIKAGAAGYLLKEAGAQEVAHAIRTVYRGEALLHPSVAARLMQEISAGRDPQEEALTERELEVLRLIARGMSNKQISSELVISEKTVKTHVSNILAKLHLADRTQAALYAVRKRIVDLG